MEKSNSWILLIANDMVYQCERKVTEVFGRTTSGALEYT